MSNSRLRLTAATGLVVGAVLGMAGTFAPSAAWRGRAWGLDGTALILSGAAMTLEASAPSFAAGVALWAPSLVLVGASKTMPLAVNGLGFIAALLFAVVAVRIFMCDALTPLSQPLPFFAYPFLVATLFGWAWAHYEHA